MIYEPRDLVPSVQSSQPPVTYSVHVQGVHGEVIRVQVEGLEELLHRQFFALKLVHDAVSIHAVGFFDEAQQMLLVHAGRGVDVGVHLFGGGGQQRPEEERGWRGVLPPLVTRWRQRPTDSMAERSACLFKNFKFLVFFLSFFYFFQVFSLALW